MKQKKKGFTLAELLIVVAIIAVLVAISIPIFTRQLERARDAASVANLRSAYAVASEVVLDNDMNSTPSGSVKGNQQGLKYTYYTYNGRGQVTFTGMKLPSKEANNWSGMAEGLPFYQLMNNTDPKRTFTTTANENHGDKGKDFKGTVSFYFDSTGKITGIYIY